MSSTLCPRSIQKELTWKLVRPEIEIICSFIYEHTEHHENYFFLKNIYHRPYADNLIANEFIKCQDGKYTLTEKGIEVQRYLREIELFNIIRRTLRP